MAWIAVTTAVAGVHRVKKIWLLLMPRACVLNQCDEDELNASFFLSSEEDSPHPSLSNETSANGRQHPGPGVASDLTVFMAYLLVFQYSVRHSLTTKALQELLQLISVLLPSGSTCPRSVRSLKNFFTPRFPDKKPSMQQYCLLSTVAVMLLHLNLLQYHWAPSSRQGWKVRL